MHESSETQDLPTVSGVSDRESRLDEVVLRYLKAIDAGRLLDPRELIDQHPDLADELRDFFKAGEGPVGAILREPCIHAPAMPARVGRCDILDELGRGGMGAVLRGRDTDLGRDVAVKVLLERHRDSPELAKRFVEEARIAGQLQHPGVTPVYELGAFPDRRPYFTMKLVKGKTLAALLAARKDPAEDRTRFVAIFGQVCHAVAYAHARGVIHRDLKPANVMVGAFGEVQVLDWGLAKVLTQEAAEAPAEGPATLIRTGREAGADTGAGSVMGTPAYMAPEQARGEVGSLDEHCDVFGLGAILCEVLTGQPAYTGRSSEEVYRKAKDADTGEALARLYGCGADAELIGLAKRCLAAEPADRPRNAGEVAAAVTAYQESVSERLRQAELARAAEAARAEEAKETAAQERKAREAAQAWAQAERRKRRAQLGMAAAVLLLVVLGGGAGAWYRQQYLEMVRDTEAALVEAAAHRDAGQWAKAKAALERASGRLGGGGPEELRRQLGQATTDLALVDRLEDIRLKRSTIVEGKFDDRTAERDYAAAFRDARLGEEGQPVEIVAVRVRASAVWEHLVAALDDWAATTKDPKRRAWLLELARRADPDEWRDRFRDPKVWGDRAALEKLAAELLRDEALLAKQMPHLLTALGNELRWAKGDAVPLLAAAQARRPGDFWLNFRLGNSLREVKRWDEAVGYYRGALAVRPESAAVRNNLGNALKEQGHLDKAIKEYREALVLDPKHAKAHHNLGNALKAKGQLDEALREYRAAIALDPTFALPHYGLGLALRDKGQLDDAIKEFRMAIALDPNFSNPHISLGALLCDVKRDYDGAAAHFRKAIDLDPKNADAHYNLGVALSAKKHLNEAIEEYHTAIRLDPKFAKAHDNLGLALEAQGRLDAAIEEYRAAIRLDPTYALPHNRLGVALKKKGLVDEAMKEYQAAIKIDPKFALPHYNLGAALGNKGQLAGC